MAHTPEENFHSLTRIKNAFEAAAKADTGEARVFFEQMDRTVSDLFNKHSSSLSPVKFFTDMQQIHDPIGQLLKIRESGSNPAASEVLDQISNIVKKEHKYMMGF